MRRTGWVQTAHGLKAAVCSVDGFTALCRRWPPQGGQILPSRSRRCSLRDEHDFSPSLEPIISSQSLALSSPLDQTPFLKPIRELPFCSHVPRKDGFGVPTTGLCVTPELNKEKQYRAQAPWQTPSPGRLGRSGRRVVLVLQPSGGGPGHPAPLRGQEEQRGEPRLCSALGSETGRASPPPGPPAPRGDDEGHGRRAPGVRAGPHRPRPCGGNGCLQRGRAAGSACAGTVSAPTAPCRQGPSGAGRGWVRRPVPGEKLLTEPQGARSRSRYCSDSGSRGC